MGAEVSVIPPSSDDTRFRAAGPTLSGANCSSIRTYSSRTLPLTFNFNHFNWKFIIADVSQLLLGANFLLQHSLLVDVKGKRLVNSKTFESVTLRQANFTAPHLGLVAASNNEYTKILNQFPDILAPQFTTSQKLGVQHHIPTSGPPLHARAHRLPLDKLQQVKEEFCKMEEMGIVCCSDSPLLMVPKV